MQSSEREPPSRLAAHTRTTPLTACTASIEVTLRSLDGLDDFPERKFFLTPNAPVPIGRSSKNTTKRLMSGPDNAFIDSPVISREHALISASTATGIPIVFIKDNGSMHGTFINSKPLDRNKEYLLHSGDELRFGMNVVRDQGTFLKPCFLELQADPAILDSFIAKKYRFQSQIASAISRGFSVPDIDTEEEEDMEIEEETAPPPVRYGSQTNPVNLDDFEDVPQQVINLEEEEPVSVKGDGKLPNDIHNVEDVDDDQSEIEEEPLDDYDGAEEAQNHSFGLVSDSLATPEEEDSEDEADHTNVDSDGEDDASNLSHTGSMSNGDSDAETDSESEAEDADAVRRQKLEAMLKHEGQKSATEEDIPRPPFALATTPNLYTIKATSKLYQEMFHSSPALNCSATFSENINNVVAPKEVGNLFSESFSTSAWEPLPPRPAAPKPSMWGPPVTDVSNTYIREQNPSPWFEPSPSTMGFSYSAPEPRPMKMDYLGQVLNSEPAPAPAPAVGMPTPPMPALDESNPMNTQANPRTKVSISEIVEDAQQQPPSPPQSVASPAPKNLKRKAELLDADEKEFTEAPPAVQDVTMKEIVQAPQTAVAEPPAKRQRGSLAAAARTAATFVAGGLFAVGCLVMSPDSAFK
jgi:hypothetical protein